MPPESQAAQALVLWELRYRSPLAPTKGVDTVLIGTSSTDEHQARAVADYWLSKERSSPSTVFVYIRPAVVMTDVQMRKELGDRYVPSKAAERVGA